jgi:hypothetical protein
MDARLILSIEGQTTELNDIDLYARLGPTNGRASMKRKAIRQQL